MLKIAFPTLSALLLLTGAPTLAEPITFCSVTVDREYLEYLLDAKYLLKKLGEQNTLQDKIRVLEQLTEISQPGMFGKAAKITFQSATSAEDRLATLNWMVSTAERRRILAIESHEIERLTLDFFANENLSLPILRTLLKQNNQGITYSATREQLDNAYALMFRSGTPITRWLISVNALQARTTVGRGTIKELLQFPIAPLRVWEVAFKNDRKTLESTMNEYINVLIQHSKAADPEQLTQLANRMHQTFQSQYPALTQQIDILIRKIARPNGL